MIFFLAFHQTNKSLNEKPKWFLTCEFGMAILKSAEVGFIGSGAFTGLISSDDSFVDVCFSSGIEKMHFDWNSSPTL